MIQAPAGQPRRSRRLAADNPRRAACALLLAVALSASACQGTGEGDEASRIVELTIEACRYRPTLETVSEILALRTLTSAAAIARAICDAVTPTAEDGVSITAPTVEGVPVRGEFVR